MWEWQFKNLAERAGMGDVKAMLRLGEWFRGQLPEEYLRLEAQWESAPESAEEELAAYLGSHQEDEFNARAGILWYLRAADYGSDLAEESVSRHPRWGGLALIPERFFRPRQDLRIHIQGSLLRKAGLLNMKADQEYSIRSLDSDGIFIAETYHGYEGPDEDGFGMEELYDFYGFDEFFNPLGCLVGYSNLDYRNNEDRFRREIKSAMDAYARRRDNYWKNIKLGNDSARYRWLLAEHKGVKIRNGVLVFYNDGGTEYTIPECVSAIGAYAFSGNDTLETILVPEHVQSIADGAFGRCGRLRRLILPDHLTVLGRKLCWDSRSLEEIHLPDRLEEIPEGMFQFVKALKRVSLPKGLKRIGNEAFSYSGLLEITLPDGLEVGRRAFAGSELSKISFPESVKMGAEPFRFCSKLTEVNGRGSF